MFTLPRVRAGQWDEAVCMSVSFCYTLIVTRLIMPRNIPGAIPFLPSSINWINGLTQKYLIGIAIDIIAPQKDWNENSKIANNKSATVLMFNIK